MKREPRLWLWYGAAGLLAAGALWLTVRTAASTPRALAQLARRRGDLVQLQGLSERWIQQRSALQTVVEAGGQPVDLAAWFREQRPDLPVELSDRETVNLLEGWVVRRVDVRWADVTLAEVGLLANRLESLTPPWRVAEIQVAAGRRAGQGRVTLTLEALAKSGSGTQL